MPPKSARSAPVRLERRPRARPEFLATLLLFVWGFFFAVPSSAQLPVDNVTLLYTSVSPFSSLPIEGDRFGRSMAVADFNCDGLQDMIVGVPGFSTFGGTSLEDAGMIRVLRGTESGFTLAGNLFQSEFGASIEEGDRFGWVLAVGNFNGDRSPEGYECMDLAIGVPYENVAGVDLAGAVSVMHGTPLSGYVLDRPTGTTWHQDVANVPGTNLPFDLFGTALAVGDFDGDTFDDLAIGVPGKSFTGADFAGQVVLLRGSPAGLEAPISTAMWTAFLNQNRTGIADTAGTEERFGIALAACDIDGDLNDDLVVGVPGQVNLSSGETAGGIHTFFGSKGFGLDLAAQSWEPSGSQDRDRFGSSLAGGEFDSSRLGCEVAVGSPYLGDNRGVVTMHKPAPGGGSSYYTAISENLFSGEVASANEFFGTTLRTVDVDGDGLDELFVGANDYAATTGAVFWWDFANNKHDSYRVTDFVASSTIPPFNAHLGQYIFAGDVDNDGADEVFFALPLWPPQDNAGSLGLPRAAGVAVQVRFDTSLFKDGFESGDTGAWDG